MCYHLQHLPLLYFVIFILFLIYLYIYSSFFLFVMSRHNDENQNLVESWYDIKVIHGNEIWGLNGA